MLPEAYHGSSVVCGSGARPSTRKRIRAGQTATFGNDTIALAPIRSICLRTSSGRRTACKVWLRITKSNAPSG